MSELVNVPMSEVEKMLSAPLELARLEASRLVQAGDVAGANRRIAEGIDQSAAMRAQIARQQAAPPVPGQPTPADAALTPEQRVAGTLQRRLEPYSSFVRSMMPPQMRDRLIRQAEEDAGIVRDPRFDPTQPFGLGPASRPRI
jgi:hypothetical protein